MGRVDVSAGAVTGEGEMVDDDVGAKLGVVEPGADACAGVVGDVVAAEVGVLVDVDVVGGGCT